MNALVISEDTLAEQLAECKDGETGDFTVKGGTLHLVPGVGAVVSFETVTKKGYAKPKDDDADEPDEETMPRKGMSAAAKAVVSRKAPSY